MQFHGSEIFVGDKVFDVAMGWGTVSIVDDVRNGFFVMFGNRRMFFNTDGKTPFFPNATLYWADPFHGVKPDKSLKYWPVFSATAETLSTELLKLRDGHV